MTRSAGRLGVARRDFLRRTGVAVITIGATPSILAACGGDDDTAASPSATGGGASPEAPDATGDMNFLSWEGYDIPVDSMEAWRKDQGITVNPTYIANHDEIQAKIKGGGAAAGYDIITYYQGYMPLYTELGHPHPARREQAP